MKINKIHALLPKPNFLIKIYRLMRITLSKNYQLYLSKVWVNGQINIQYKKQKIQITTN